MNTIKLFDNPKLEKRVHGVLTVIWGLLIIPSVTIWKESIMWVVLMSAWANFSGHFSAYQAAKGEKNIEKEVKKNG